LSPEAFILLVPFLASLVLVAVGLVIGKSSYAMFARVLAQGKRRGTPPGRDQAALAGDPALGGARFSEQMPFTCTTTFV